MSLENRSIFQLMKKGHLWHSPWVENGCCHIHQSDLVHDPPKKPLSHVLKLYNGPIFGNQAQSPSSETTLYHCCRRSYVGGVFTLHGHRRNNKRRRLKVETHNLLIYKLIAENAHAVCHFGLTANSLDSVRSLSHFFQ